MAKRLSERQRENIRDSFTNGKTVDELSEEYGCSKLTISRNLKKDLGDKIYKDLIKSKKIFKNSSSKKLKTSSSQNDVELNKDIELGIPNLDSDNHLVAETNEDLVQSSQFMEIPLLDYEIDEHQQKDLSSKPIEEIDFPKMVYMIVDKNVELQTKLLKEFPEWQFLPQEDLNRKTLKIYFDLKNAKRECNKEQKVIKVPNPDIFKIVAPILISRGITRIVSSQQLIAL